MYADASVILFSTANACFWTAFGFGVMDYIIMVPNGLGAILGFIQMFLRLVVPSGDTSPSEIDTQVDDKSEGFADVDIEATASASTTEAPAKEETEDE